MPRLLALLAVTGLMLIAVACGSDDDGSTSAGDTQETETKEPEPTTISATPAVAPADQEAYRQSIVGQGAVQETCSYMPEEAVVDCTDRGIYKLEPPPAADVSCVVGLTGGDTPEFILCSNPAGGDLKFFVIGP